MLDQLTVMTPGECRWIGRRDIHVYCFGTRVDGRYLPDVRLFKIATDECVWNEGGWSTAAEIAAQIKHKLEGR